MLIIKAILFFLALCLSGWLLLRLFFPCVKGGLKIFALSYGLGWGWLTTQLFIILFWLKWSWGLWLVGLLSFEIAVLIFLYWLTRPDWLSYLRYGVSKIIASAASLRSWAVREKFLLVGIFCFIFLALGNALVQPLVAWDSLVNWSLKAKAIFQSGQVVFDVARADYWINLGNAGYPWHLSLSWAWLSFWLGDFNEFANNLITFGFYVGLLALLYDFLRQRTERSIALLFTFFAASAPLLIFHVFSAYGDLPLAFFALASFILLFEACLNRRTSAWVVAGIFGGLATIIKNEGIFYCLAALPVIWLMTRVASRGKFLFGGLYYAAGFILASGCWWLFKAVNDLSVRNTETGWVWHPETIGEIAKFWFTYEGFNIFWPLLFLILLFNWRFVLRRRSLAVSWLYLGLIWLCFVFVYVFSKSYVFALDGTIILRNSLTFFPIAVALAALTFSRQGLEVAEVTSQAESLSWPLWLRHQADNHPVLRQKKKFLKFLLVGSSGAVIDFGLLAVFVELFNWHPILANIVSFSVALVNNFLLNKFWTWRNASPEKIRQFSKYGLTSVAGLGLNTILMWFGLLFGWHYLLIKVFVSAIVAFWNYFINNIWTFNSRRQEIL